MKNGNLIEIEERALPKASPGKDDSIRTLPVNCEAIEVDEKRE
jgi:hypothetical protein